MEAVKPPSGGATRPGCQPRVVFGPDPVTIEDVVLLAGGRARAALSDDSGWRARIRAGCSRLEQQLEAEARSTGRTRASGPPS